MPSHRQKEKVSLLDITKRIETELADAVVEEALGRFSTHVSAHQAQAIRSYIAILLFWNQSVNLTSVSQPRELLVRHFGESMFAVGSVPISSGRLADFGSGAGFPGLAIKLLRPGLEVHLIEPNLKKTSFLAEIVRRLGLAGVRIECRRAEELSWDVNDCDFVTARAVGHLSRLLSSSWRILRPNGRLILWLGRDDAQRLSSLEGWRWRDQIAIPASSRRILLIGEKQAD